MKYHHLAVALAAVAASSCTVGPDFKRPRIGVGTSWKETRAVAGARLPDTWWKLFNDRQLNQLIERALAANPDIAAAKARVNTARALVGVDRARMFPILNLNSSAGISRASESAMSANLPPGISVDPESQRYRGTFDLSFDPDLWGGVRRQVEASTAQAAASEALLDAQRLGVATEVARQYFLLRGLDAQQAVLKDTIESRQRTLDIQKSRADAGLIDGLSTSQARTELELARNDLAVVERQRGSAEHAIAVLCGTTPASFHLAAQPSTRSLPQIHAALPAEVLMRRPDVRAAEENLRAANARIGAAEAAFYPSFNLFGTAGFESVEPKDFLKLENRVLSIGTSLAAPVFDGGRNTSNYQAAISRRDEALASYRNNLLVALREVEDSLVDLKGLARSRRALEQALASASDTHKLSQERYDKGLSSYLEVVDADRTVLRVKLVLANNDAQQRISLAALAKALGGGWAK